jgi:hypothetical protein
VDQEGAGHAGLDDETPSRVEEEDRVLGAPFYLDDAASFESAQQSDSGGEIQDVAMGKMRFAKHATFDPGSKIADDGFYLR